MEIPPREMLVFEHELTDRKALFGAVQGRLAKADAEQLRSILKLVDAVLY